MAMAMAMLAILTPTLVSLATEVTMLATAAGDKTRATSHLFYFSNKQFCFGYLLN